MTGKKYDSDKPRLDLISSHMLVALGRVLGFGAKKYGEQNWRGGLNYSRLFGAVQRHLWAWHGGEDKDPETGYNHLWHAAAGLMMLIEFEITSPALDDRYSLKENVEDIEDPHVIVNIPDEELAKIAKKRKSKRAGVKK